MVECSRLELTDDGRPNVRGDCDTGGIDAYGARGFRVARNDIRGFWCVAGQAGPGIRFSAASRGTTIDRNLLLDNARGIGLGNGIGGGMNARTYDDPPECEGDFGHLEALVRNNFVAVGEVDLHASAAGAMTGISLEAVCDVRVAHNTVAFSMDPRSSAIEFRFAHTDRLLLANNLMSDRVVARDDASTQTLGNVESVALDYFDDVAAGDLHLTADAADAIDSGARLANGVVDDDFDGDPRTDPRDVGADERE